MPVVLTPSSDETLNIDSLVEQVYSHIEGTAFGFINQLSETIDATATSIKVDFKQAVITPGSRLGIGLEVLHVWDYDEVSRTATVRRGMKGSTATEHVAGEIVQVQPRVSKFDVVTQLRNDIRSWPPDIFDVAVVEFSQASSRRGYDLDVDDFTRVLDVRYTDVGASSFSATGWRYLARADTTDYPSGRAIVFRDGTPSRAVQVVYARKFRTDPFTLDTLLSTLGLTPSQAEIAVLGAASRLIREGPRTDTRAQGQSRQAEEVPPGHLTNTSRNLKNLRDDLLHAEIRRLREDWPPRKA